MFGMPVSYRHGGAGCPAFEVHRDSGKSDPAKPSLLRAIPVGIRLVRRADARLMGGPVKPGHDMTY